MLTKITIQDNVVKLDSVTQPETILVTDFGSTTASTFIERLNKLNNASQGIIPIQIDSFGGQVYSLLGMLDAMAATKKPLATFVESKAMSCGAVLLSAGTPGLRFASKNSTILIHEVSADSIGKNTDLQADANEAARLNGMLLEILAKNSNKPKNFYADMIHAANNADLFITPKEAVKYGLIDKIGIPTFKIDLRVTYSMDIR